MIEGDPRPDARPFVGHPSTRRPLWAVIPCRLAPLTSSDHEDVVPFQAVKVFISSSAIIVYNADGWGHRHQEKSAQSLYSIMQAPATGKAFGFPAGVSSRHWQGNIAH